MFSPLVQCPREGLCRFLPLHSPPMKFGVEIESFLHLTPSVLPIRAEIRVYYIKAGLLDDGDEEKEE